MDGSNQELSEFAVEAAQAAAIMKLLGNEARLLLLCHLAEAFELSAGELTSRIGMSQSALSQHLALLREDGLVTTRKEAQKVFYRITEPKVRKLLALLHELYCPELGKGMKRDPRLSRNGSANFNEAKE